MHERKFWRRRAALLPGALSGMCARGHRACPVNDVSFTLLPTPQGQRQPHDILLPPSIARQGPHFCFYVSLLLVPSTHHSPVAALSSLTWILQQLPNLPSSGFCPSSTHFLHSRDRFASVTSMLENAGGSQPLQRQTFQVLSHVAPSNHSSLISHILLYMVLLGLTLVGREQSGPWCIFVGLRTCQKSEHFTYTFRCFWTSLEKLDNLATGSPHSNMAALFCWPQSPPFSNVL